MSLLELDGIVKRYGDLTAVDGLSLTVERGELVCLLGPSGCGKSTTLRTIAGFETPDEGSVRMAVDGTARDVTDRPPNERTTAMVFQDWALFPNKTVAENVAFGLKMDGVDRESRRDRALETLKLVEMSSQADADPTGLSGGQKQRVALARALAVDPDLLLLDEPLSNLDRRLRETMQLELKSIHEQLETTMVYVTHDQDEAFTLADRIAVVDDGRVEQVGPPTEVYTDPETLFVESFLGTSNFLTCHVTRIDDGRARLDTPFDEPVFLSETSRLSRGDRVTASIRPERLSVRPVPAESDDAATPARTDGASRPGDRLRSAGRVESRLHRGARYRYELRVGDTELVTRRRVADRLDVEPGDRVVVSCDGSEISFFDADGRRLA